MNNPDPTPERLKKTYSLSSTTVQRIERMSTLTIRPDSHIVDIAVSKLWAEYELTGQIAITPAPQPLA